MKRENFSRKRQAILQAVCGTDCHPTAEWVYHAVKPQYTDLSLEPCIGIWQSSRKKDSSPAWV